MPRRRNSCATGIRRPPGHYWNSLECRSIRCRAEFCPIVATLDIIRAGNQHLNVLFKANRRHACEAQYQIRDQEITMCADSDHQPSRRDQMLHFRMFDSPLQPGEFAWLQLKKSLTMVQNQLLARKTNWSIREGWWETATQELRHRKPPRFAKSSRIRTMIPG